MGLGGAATSRAWLTIDLLSRQFKTMALAQSKVTAQGQISIPAEVRRKLGIGPGSVLEWDEHGDAAVVRKAARYTSEGIHRAIFP